MWPLIVYFALVVALVAGMVLVSYPLGERHGEPATLEPYESGIAVTGTAQSRHTSHFYLVALSFVIFDLESAFIFIWAVSARSSGWQGYIGVFTFIIILSVILLYEWKQGALDWNPRHPASGGPIREA